MNEQLRQGCPDPAVLIDIADGDPMLVKEHALNEHVRLCTACVGQIRRYQRLISLIRRAAAAASTPAGDCPTPDILARYVEHLLEGESLDRAERHLVSCADCRRTAVHASAMLGDLHETRVNPAVVVDRVLPQVVERNAGGAVFRRRRRDTRRHPSIVVRRSSWIPWTIAAAAVLLVILMVTMSGPQMGQKRNSGGERKNVPEIVERQREQPEGRDQQAELPRQSSPPAPQQRLPIAPVQPPPVVRQENPEPIEPPGIVPEQPQPKTPPAIVDKRVPDSDTRPPEAPVMVVAVVSEVEGRATINGSPAAVGGGVTEGSEVVLDDKARLSLTAGDGGGVLVNKGTSMTWKNDGTLTLARGEIFVRVVPRKSPFVVRTPHGDVTVKGTEFDVRSDERQTAVSTLMGEVECGNTHGKISVPMLRQTAMTGNRAPSATRPFKPSDLLAWTRGLQPDLFIKRVETFDGNKLNADLWSESDPRNCLRQEGRILIKGEAVCREESEMAALTGAFSIDGELDLQIDYRLPPMERAPGDAPATGCFFAIKHADQRFSFRIGIRRYGDQWVFDARLENAEGWKQLNVPSDRLVESEGRFRITRKDGSLVASIGRGEKWIPLADHVSAPEGPYRVVLQGCGDDPSKAVEIDNVNFVRGTFVCPESK